ncbi:hypothetical protein P8X24_07470 [Pyrococcus kukulkanii]|uniref:hypothetical protein n=1 Tax=Pyrococcus kukulkanii TaxID=1609559 RepID=UPI0035687AF9
MLHATAAALELVKVIAKSKAVKVFDDFDEQIGAHAVAIVKKGRARYVLVLKSIVNAVVGEYWGDFSELLDKFTDTIRLAGKEYYVFPAIVDEDFERVLKEEERTIVEWAPKREKKVRDHEEEEEKRIIALYDELFDLALQDPRLAEELFAQGLL